MYSIIIWGHSLGTGIGCSLAELISISDKIDESHELYAMTKLLAHDSKSKLQGLFLEAPFESLRTAAMTHFSTAPLWVLPKRAQDYIIDNFICLCDLLASIDRVERIEVPVMIVHALNDWVISVQQGINLATRLCRSLNQTTRSKKVCVTEGITRAGKPCRLAVFPDGGHNYVSLQPEFHRVIAEFKEYIAGFH